MSRILIALTAIGIALGALSFQNSTPVYADQCFDTDMGTVCIADPPPPPACAPNCAAPAWHPPLVPNITLCHLYGYCQDYVNGLPSGAPYKPTDPVKGPWDQIIVDGGVTVYIALFERSVYEIPAGWQPCNPTDSRYYAC
jgi:hypothetical protein